jgi:hypothetical protein
VIVCGEEADTWVGAVKGNAQEVEMSEVLQRPTITTTATEWRNHEVPKRSRQRT